MIFAVLDKFDAGLRRIPVKGREEKYINDHMNLTILLLPFPVPSDPQRKFSITASKEPEQIIRMLQTA